MKDLHRNQLAVMFTDIVGFTSLMEKNEVGAMEALVRSKEALMEQLESHSGSLVKVMGDGTLSIFSSPSAAVGCALSFQESVEKDDFRIRIGIHWGDVIQGDNDVYGDTVNVSSRLEKLSYPGCICISREILNGYRGKGMPEFRSLGLRKLRGLVRLIEVYALSGACELPEPESSHTDEVRKPANKGRAPSVAVIPFENLGSEKDAFYAYGISTDLVSDLSRAGSINIASTKDVVKVMVDEPTLDEIASRLGVRYVARGSLWKEKSKFRISVELSDRSENGIVWIDSWEDDWFLLCPKVYLTGADRLA